MQRDQIISAVEKPGRYTGGEAFSVIKDHGQVKLTMALAFPEVYEIAMSHQGLKVLYDQLAGRPDVAAERVFCPWTDLMDLLEQTGQAPWSLESGAALGSFDVIGFSLQYELTYANLLHMLRLAGVPLRRDRRGPEHPLVIAGGPCAVNPEPLADFLDIVAVGDGERLIHQICDLVIAAKEQSWPRQELYRRAAAIEGLYVPALYEPIYQDGRLVTVRAVDAAAPARVKRRIEPDLGAFAPPQRPVLPAVKPVHDRLGVEIARGCTRGCRFCQAGFIYRPVRERPLGQALNAALEGLACTGMEELALLSLSAGDYSAIEPLARALMDACEPLKVSLSLPSLRVDSLSQELIAQIKRVRKTGFTLAPEAGSEHMRRRINKDLTEEQILDTARLVYGLGWNLIKLYFMIGLPGESDSDVEAIGQLARQVAQQALAAGRGRGKKPLVHASIGIFVPKPHTPFQWEGQLDLAQAEQRLRLAKASLGDSRLRAKWNDARLSVLEGVLARGDRRLSRVLELVVAAGCRFDGWSEHLNFTAWLAAMEDAGLTLEEYLRPRGLDEALPWDHIDVGVGRDYLLAEREKAVTGQATADCRGGKCGACGVCDFKEIRPRLTDEKLPAPVGPAAAPEGEERFKYRYRLEKTGPARFLGHLEMMTQLARAFRRAGAPLAHSRGFHPQAQVKACSALPLGVESLVEVIEITTLRPIDPVALAERVNQTMPQGMRLADGRAARPGDNLAEPDLVGYQIDPPRPLDPARLSAFAQAPEFFYARITPKGRRDIDFKATIRKLELDENRLLLEVGRQGGRPKPAEVLEAVFGLEKNLACRARALKTLAKWGDN